MTKRTERRHRTQAGNEASAGLACLVEPMLAGMPASRQHRLVWVHAHGLAAFDALFRDEALALAGPKGAARTHCPPRIHGLDVGAVVKALMKIAERHPAGVGEYDVLYL